MRLSGHVGQHHHRRIPPLPPRGRDRRNGHAQTIVAKIAAVAHDQVDRSGRHRVGIVETHDRRLRDGPAARIGIGHERAFGRETRRQNGPRRQKEKPTANCPACRPEPNYPAAPHASRFWRRPACDSVLPSGSRPRAERFPCVRSPKAGFRRRHPVRTVCFCRRSCRPGDPQKLRDLLAAHDGRSGVPLPCASRQNAAPERLPTVAAVLQERPCDRLSSYGSCRCLSKRVRLSSPTTSAKVGSSDSGSKETSASRSTFCPF